MTRDDRPPGFFLYVLDLVADGKVEVMTTDEFGAYILLLCKAWFEDPPGSIPDDDYTLSRWTRLTPDQWTERRTRVLAPFRLGMDSRWHQKRMRKEFEKMRASLRKRSEAGSYAAAQKWGNNDRESSYKNRSRRLMEARKKGTHTQEEWIQMLEYYGNSCVKCGSTGSNIVKDHIIPIYQGGSDSILNIQPLCQSCNSSKGPENKDYRDHVYIECLRNACADACETPANACLSTSTSTSTSNTNTPLPPKGGDGSDPEKPDELFESFYRAYPRHENPEKARTAFRKSGITHGNLSGVLRWIEIAKQSSQWKKPDKIPYASTFLNQKRWLGDPPPIISYERDLVGESTSTEAESRDMKQNYLEFILAKTPDKRTLEENEFLKAFESNNQPEGGTD